MNIQIIGDNFNVSLSVKKLVDEKVGQKLDKLLSKFDPQMHSALMRIQKDKFDNFLVNFDMNLPNKEHIFGQTKHIILESALIDVQEQAEKQIKKHRSN